MSRQPIANPRFWRAPIPGRAESRLARDSQACYAPHAHAEFSIGAVDEGRSTFRSDSLVHTLGAGELILIPAQLAHACNPEPDAAWSYQMLYVDEAWLREIAAECNLPAGLPSSPEIIRSAALPAAFRTLNHTLFSARDWPVQEAALIRFIGDVLMASQSAKARHTSPLRHPRLRVLENAKARIEAECEQSLPLAELAAEAGLSRYHFLRAFQQAFGLTPHAWQLNARINRAKRLIDSGLPFAELALALGFADQSHFQRHFKRHVAVPPGHYQRNFVQD